MEENESLYRDRWLLSYADLVTLLFALFVVLFASAHLEAHRTRKVASVTAPAVSAQRVIPRADPIKKALDEGLLDELREGKIEINLEKRGLVIRLRDASFFRPGDDQILPDAYPSIERIARVLAPASNAISVEGHADATPIHNSRFRDNWELSGARGMELLRHLSREFGIPYSRMSAAAYADTRPLSDNASEQGRAQNRRVDIVVLTETQG